MSNRRIIEEYWEAFLNQDIDTYESLMHPDIVVTYPQSGEVFVGRDNSISTVRNYPVDLPAAEGETIGTSERSISGAGAGWFGVSSVTVTSEGNLFVAQGTLTYPNGELYYLCSIFRIKQGLIAEETSYFGQPFEAPEWRIQWAAGGGAASG